jgi:beta-aspartyl-peptidase (threonine type)
MKPALILHGGAWDIPDEAVEACKAGCLQALTAGWSILAAGGSALDAIEAVIVILEDNPVFDAGYGSHLNLDGHVECDAIVMDGATLRAGAAAALRRIKNPVCLARKILESPPHMMLVSEGAERFAKDHEIELCEPEELVSEIEWEAFLRCRNDEHAAANHRGHEQGTVGAVALDSAGSLIAATSTGGTCCKLPGRVGDSPLIGCGCYADAEAGGVSCTGYGEAIMKVILAKSATDFLRRNHGITSNGLQNFADVAYSAGPRPLNVGGAVHDLPQGGHDSHSLHAVLAAREAIHLLSRRTHSTGGLVLLDREGHAGWAFNTPRMAYAYVASDGTFVTAV